MSIIDEIKDLEYDYSTMTYEFGQLEGQYKTLLEDISDTVKILANLQNEQEKLQKALVLLKIVQEITRNEIKEGFEGLVTHALRFIYSDDYSFHLEFGERGNLQELDFNIKTPEFSEPGDPIDTCGGGVLDIISLALRCVLLEVSVPRVDGFILLDESLKHLSEDYLDNAGKFLQEINQRLGRQIIFITHQKHFIDNADNGIEIS